METVAKEAALLTALTIWVDTLDWNWWLLAAGVVLSEAALRSQLPARKTVEIVSFESGEALADAEAQKLGLTALPCVPRSLHLYLLLPCCWFHASLHAWPVGAAATVEKASETGMFASAISAVDAVANAVAGAVADAAVPDPASAPANDLACVAEMPCLVSARVSSDVASSEASSPAAPAAAPAAATSASAHLEQILSGPERLLP